MEKFNSTKKTSMAPGTKSELLKKLPRKKLEVQKQNQPPEMGLDWWLRQVSSNVKIGKKIFTQQLQETGATAFYDL